MVINNQERGSGMDLKKYNEIQFVAANTVRGIMPVNSETVYALMYVTYLWKNNNIKECDELRDCIERMDKERKDFINGCLSDDFEGIRNLDSMFSLDEVRDYLICFPRTEGKLDNEFSTPDSLSNLSLRLMNIKAGDFIADFGCGIGSFMAKAIFANMNNEFYGVELNRSSAEIARIRAEVIGAHINIETNNMFYIDQQVKFDKIFSNYPFGMRLKELQTGVFLEELCRKVPEIKKATSSDWIYNMLLVDHLTEDGKAVAIMTNGGTWNGTDVQVRKYFVENGYIEAIIALPSRLFSYASIPTTLIVLSKNNKFVRMIDAQELCMQGRRQNELTEENICQILEMMDCDTEKSRVISYEEIANNDFALNPSRYLEVQETIENAVEFGTVIKRITRGAPVKASDLDDMVSDEPTNIQYLMLANIQNGMIKDELPFLKELDSKLDKYCISNGNLLLSKNGAPFKIAIAEVAEGMKILGNGNLFIIELDTSKVIPFYIKAFFDSETGGKTLQKISVGAAIPNISAESLRKVLIPLPSLEEQERIADLYVSKMQQIRKLENELQEAKNELATIFNN